MQTFNALMLFAAKLLWIRSDAFWAYFAAAAICVTALFSIRKRASDASSLEKIVAFGPLFFSAPLVVFASEHFTATRDIAQLVPAWIPAHVFWVYFVGTCLIASALSITLQKHARLAATLLALMFFLFVLLIHIPSVISTPHDRTRWAVVLRDLSFSGGALALAGAQTSIARARQSAIFVAVGRVVIAFAAVYFGVGQFLHPELLPGIPLERATPTWIPLHLLWSYLAGVVLLGTGASLLANTRPRLAATSLGVMILLLVAIVYLPLVVSKPTDVGSGLNYFFDTLMFAGALLLLADALPQHDAVREVKERRLQFALRGKG